MQFDTYALGCESTRQPSGDGWHTTTDIEPVGYYGDLQFGLRRRFDPELSAT
jgi:hypothetical protein